MKNEMNEMYLEHAEELFMGSGPDGDMSKEDMIHCAIYFQNLAIVGLLKEIKEELAVKHPPVVESEPE